jgi:hypothetical protein
MIYGVQPPIFPTISPAEDNLLGRLMVIQAGFSITVKKLAGESFVMDINHVPPRGDDNRGGTYGSGKSFSIRKILGSFTLEQDINVLTNANITGVFQRAAGLNPVERTEIRYSLILGSVKFPNKGRNDCFAFAVIVER